RRPSRRCGVAAQQRPRRRHRRDHSGAVSSRRADEHADPGRDGAAMTMAEAPAPQLADLEALYEAHHRQAIGLAYRILGDLGDAEEVVQEVFLSVWRTGHQYDPTRGSTHAWVL